MPSLIVTSGVLAGQVFSFADNAVVGRGQFSEVRLNHPTVSRRHALIRKSAQGYEVVDQDSANGTRYRGHRIDQPVRVNDGDELEFGEIKTIFRSATSEISSLHSAVAEAEDNATRARAAAGAKRAAGAAPDAPGMRELLARLKLFCDLGALARHEESLREQLGRALDALLAAFPRASRAAVYSSVAVSDHLPLIAQRSSASSASGGVEFVQVEAFLLEALRMQGGISVTGAASRDALAARLRSSALPAALLGMPLRLGKEVLGVLYLESSEHENAWRSADLELFAGVAGQLAWMMAAQHAQSPERAIEAHDLALARRIQQRFLPQSPPVIAGYRIADSYAAARVIGGDHYDFFNYRDGRAGLVIADVSGKSVSGALYMARLSVQVRTMARHLAGPVELLSGLNRKLYQELEPGMFVTMLAAVLDPESGVMEFACAGHPAPLLRSADGKVSELSEPGALPLGAMADTAFRAHTVTLAPGSCVLFYTDGLDEAHNDKKELYGKERIVKTLRESNGGAQDALDALLAEVARFAGGEPQSDDLTLITLSRERKKR
jgi:serine phosphatase RsbU (regulator of sigma subunit)/pSer/pThr/pTyr-binding forkhead associated (FHA) protein